jgi:hypothetical protein
LDRDRFAAKTTAKGCLISLDFLGFSRLKRDFSMGYTGFFLERIFLSLCLRRRRRPVGGVAFGMRKSWAVHGAELTPISDFLQSIVFDRAVDQSRTGGAYFGCGAADPPEVPGGGTTFGSRTMGAPFSMAGSTSFGWMIPFDWFSFLLRSSTGAVGSAPGVVSRGAESTGVVGFGAWANAGLATRVMPATNRQSRDSIIRMLS